MAKKHKIGVIGIGMVGKEVMSYFLNQGHQRGKDLFCYDKNSKKNFSDDISKADIIFVCVPTPSSPDGSCNTKIVESVIKKFANSDNKILIIKSTIGPGTIERLQKKVKCPLLFNPEFLTESRAREDFIKPDRQVIGHTAKSLNQAGVILSLLPQAYFASPGTLGTYNFVRLNSSEAEMGKYATNAFGAMKVVFGNILADFCSGLEKILAKEGIETKVNYENVRQMVAHDRRIGDAWLDVHHGGYRGFGGYCFPKDLDAFIVFGQKLERKLSKDDKDRKLISAGIAFLEAMRNYNMALLKSQGLNLRELSVHESEIENKLKDKSAKRKKK